MHMKVYYIIKRIWVQLIITIINDSYFTILKSFYIFTNLSELLLFRMAITSELIFYDRL